MLTNLSTYSQSLKDSEYLTNFSTTKETPSLRPKRTFYYLSRLTKYQIRLFRLFFKLYPIKWSLCVTGILYLNKEGWTRRKPKLKLSVCNWFLSGKCWGTKRRDYTCFRVLTYHSRYFVLNLNHVLQTMKCVLHSIPIFKGWEIWQRSRKRIWKFKLRVFVG